MNHSLIENLLKALNLKAFDDNAHKKLYAIINELLTNDFEKLVYILYRFDVSEEKLKKLLQQKPETDAAQIIADLLIERQLQKIKTRQQFSGQVDNINEEEKW